MHRRRLLFALIALLLAVNAWAPPAVHATEYLLFTAQEEGTIGQVYQMDEEGNLSLRQEYEVSGDSHNITVSPDGRVVVVSACWSPMLSIFFIDKDGTLNPPLDIENTPFYPNYYAGYDPVAFHSSLPLFYTGFEPLSSYQYSLTKHQVEPTSQTITLGSLYPSFHLGCSTWSGTLVSFIATSGAQDEIQTIQLKEDGSFGQINSPLQLPCHINSDFAVSPDGRWAAATTLGTPELQFIRINQDGSAELAQGLNFAYNDLNGYIKAVFTPDSRGLLLAGGGEHMLSLYTIDRTQGTLALHSWVSRESPGYHAYPPDCLAVSSDGQYAAIAAQNELNINQSVIYLVRIHPDGTLEYLHGKEVAVDHFISAVALVALPPKNAAQGWGLYE